MSNKHITAKLVSSHNRRRKPHTNRLAPADFYQLWMDYFESLEWFNLCANCKKPIKAKRAKVEHKIFEGSDSTIVIKENISSYADILPHFQIIDENKESVFNPFYKGRIKYMFVEKYRVFNQKCNCPYNDKRKNKQKILNRTSNEILFYWLCLKRLKLLKNLQDCLNKGNNVHHKT